jgi:hypothetical protein
MKVGDDAHDSFLCDNNLDFLLGACEGEDSEYVIQLAIIRGEFAVVPVLLSGIVLLSEIGRGYACKADVDEPGTKLVSMLVFNIEVEIGVLVNHPSEKLYGKGTGNDDTMS